MKRRIVAAALSAVVFAACETSTDVPARVSYTATLNGANEKPAAITTGGLGTFSATIDHGTDLLTYSVSWSGLSGAATMGHIHGPGDANAVAGVLVDFAALPATPGTSGTIDLGAAGSASGTVNLDAAITGTVSGDSLIKLFEAGRVYVNVHTAANSGGEIRGQIARQ